MTRITETLTVQMKALGPITHFSDERAGNASLFRRMEILTGNGSTARVPIISGNSLRGKFRRIAAELTQEALGVEKLPLKAYHLLYAGGTLTKDDVAESIPVETIRAVRDSLPILELFGGTVAGSIVRGCSSFGIIWPVCSETSGITGIESRDACDELIDTIMYTRRDDSQLVEREESDDASAQMIFSCEAIRPGARLVCSISLIGAREPAASMLRAVLERWLKHPTLGGMDSRGHGLVEAVIPGIETLPSAEVFAEIVRSNKDRAVSILEQL